MRVVYLKIELTFERLTSIATKILGNSLTFIMAFIMVIFWWSTNLFRSHDSHQDIGDIIFGVTFLSFFIIQKSFNRYSALIELKINELISSHDGANNSVMDTGGKTENEIRILSKEYTELDESEKVIVEEFIKGQHE